MAALLLKYLKTFAQQSLASFFGSPVVVEMTHVRTSMSQMEKEGEDDFTRDLSGALVSFNDIGQIRRVSLPTDFSRACITGLPPTIQSEAVVQMLLGFGFNIDIECVRISRSTAPPKTKALVKAENPSFAKELSDKLKQQKTEVSAVPLPIDSRRSNCRKVYISWHKATRRFWLNFGSSDIANRVAQKFAKGHYKVLGQSVTCSGVKGGAPRGARGRTLHNPVAWTVTLCDVPGDATNKDVQDGIYTPYDRPRHIEPSPVSYYASDTQVGFEVRSLLEEHGRLESFDLPPTSKGRRVKAVAWFEDEADAISACSLNKKQISILQQGKLTLTLVQSVKVKIQTPVYFASKSRIEEEMKIWAGHHLTSRVYVNTVPGFTAIKVEGANANDVVRARKVLDEISQGVILRDGENPIWASALETNGSAYMKVKVIEKELGVLIRRDKSKCHLYFYGPFAKYQQAIAHIREALKDESSLSSHIDLSPEQFSRMIRGGFKSVEQALGRNVAVFDVISKRLTVGGTRQQYDMALAVVNGADAVEIRDVAASHSLIEGDCPICFCEAENPVQTSCKHTYCLECFEDSCKSAASTSKNDFQVKCQGNGGTCSTIFTLQELKERLSSSVFESVLRSSFEEYLQRHPEAFHYCSTPDCDYVYRCTAASNLRSPACRCPNCLESVCTSCHARHDDLTCAQYKDIASGGYEALERLKKKLNIKDCPKCTTPIEKTDGCNHITCRGCKAHLCWVCMAVFNDGPSCYAHMSEAHGGHGGVP
ncbi:hypothetical protein AYO21_01655 [Fonsecaea monophora]|uniref:RING-type domain-containing protein n=1 Tax=Fonsecaea monophora TaxID=254056 RepID=A0A177FIY7_9EURO|nr:hypothetical protein AYO21_01655 [Fonsecaea monophora]OAG44198.1 hypothetical protein AYO21_01655 [Fonsecaea monophora]